MAEVNVEIGGRAYRLGCADGEEAHLEGLARRIDAEARHLSKSMGQMNETRLLLMSALMIADRCAEAEMQVEQGVKARKAAEALARAAAPAAPAAPDAPAMPAKPAGGQPGLFDAEMEAAVATAVEAAARRIEALAETLEDA